jgi:hypothetical protein
MWKWTLKIKLIQSYIYAHCIHLHAQYIYSITDQKMWCWLKLTCFSNFLTNLSKHSDLVRLYDADCPSAWDQRQWKLTCICIPMVGKNQGKQAQWKVLSCFWHKINVIILFAPATCSRINAYFDAVIWFIVNLRGEKNWLDIYTS